MTYLGLTQLAIWQCIETRKPSYR